jgi:hypothetical protein
MANQQPMKGLAMVFVVNSLSLNHLKDFALLRHLELEDPDLPVNERRRVQKDLHAIRSEIRVRLERR